MKQKIFIIILTGLSIFFTFVLGIQIIASYIFPLEESVEVVLDTKNFNYEYDENNTLFRIINSNGEFISIKVVDKDTFGIFLREFFVKTEEQNLIPKDQCRNLKITTQNERFKLLLLNNKSINIVCV